MAGVRRNLVVRAGIDITNFSRGMQSMQKTLEKKAKKIGEISKKMTMAFTLPIAAIAGVGFKMASDLAEVQNVVDTAFGKSSKKVDEWSKTTLKAYGLSELSAKRYASTIRSMTGSMGLSTKASDNMSISIAQLAGDMASFYNLKTDEAFNKLRSGLSGETEPLKQLGINLSVANLEAYALSQGITRLYQDMSEAEKVTLRYNYIMKVTSNAQGDFAKTAGSTANQTRVATESFKMATANLVQGLIPTINKLLSLVNGLINTFNGLSKGMQNFILVIALSVATLGPLLKMYSIYIKLKIILIGLYKATIIQKIIATSTTSKETATEIANNAAKNASLLTMVKTVSSYAFHLAATIASTIALGALTAAQWALNVAMNANPIGLVIMGITLLIGGFILLWKKSKGFKNFFVKMWKGIVNVVKGCINGIIGFINAYLSVWKFMINTTISLINKLIKGINKLPGVKITLLPTLSDTSLQIPKLADGGIAFGNTIANVGEYAGARTNPEVIAPLDKLQGMLNKGSNTYVFTLDGREFARVIADPMTKEMKLT